MLNVSVDRALATAKSKARAGAIDEARQIYTSVLTKFPSNKRARRGLEALPAPVVVDAPEAELNRFIVLFENGQLEEAIQFGERLAARHPQDATVQTSWAPASVRRGSMTEPQPVSGRPFAWIPAIRKRISIWRRSCRGLGRPGEALTVLIKALELAPDQADYWRSLAELLQTIRFKAYDESFANLFLKLLAQPNVCEPAHVVRRSFVF